MRHYDADLSLGMKRKVRAMQFLVAANEHQQSRGRHDDKSARGARLNRRFRRTDLL
jgi:hypothetical protein